MDKIIRTSNGLDVLVSEEDFDEVSKYKWYGKKQGRNIYAVRRLKKGDKYVSRFMHRDILGLIDPKISTDHKDHNGLNNVRGNLRSCTNDKNLKNRRPRGNAKYLGVSRNHNFQWAAFIRVEGKKIHLGLYDYEHQAAHAYNEAATMYYKDFAYLNKIDLPLEMPTVIFELRKRPNKMGLCRLRAVIQDRGKRVYKELNVAVLPDQWNGKSVINHPNATVINNVLKLKMADLQSSMATESLNGSLSLEKIAGRKVSKTLFRDFAGSCLDRWEKSKSYNSIRAYSSMLKQVLRFDKDISVEDITPDWLARYEAFNREECGEGGTLKRVAFISVILKEAIRQGVIDRDPFLIYKKPAKKNPPKVWLTMKEIGAIEKLSIDNGSDIIRNTASWFLLACYTGLRYSDIDKFNSKKMIQEGRLILYTQKTGEVVSLKLTPKIKQLIKVAEKNGPVYSNQKANQYLKAIAHHAKINKLLTFHTARHTFAVQCANLGISQEVAAKLLGHSDLKTTAIYYKIVNSRVDKEMMKWG